MENVKINDFSYTEVKRVMDDTLSIYNYKYVKKENGIDIYYLGTYIDKVEAHSIRGFVSVYANQLEKFGLVEEGGIISVANHYLLIDELYRYGTVVRYEHDSYMALLKFQSQLLQRS